MKKILIFLSVILFSTSLSGEEIEVEFSVEDAPQDTEISFDFEETIAEKKDGIPLRGKLSFDLGYQIGSPKRWITVGPYTQLIVDKQTDYGQLYSELTVRNNYAFQIENDSNAIQNRYQLDPVMRELYWKKAFDDKTLTVGRSIVTWGKADLSSIIDIISPIDNAASLFAKPEEIKIGQNLIKLDWYLNNNELNFITVPSALNNIQTEAGHPYFNSLGFTATNNIKDTDSEWAFRWNQIHDTWEFSAVAGDVHQRDPLYITKEQTWEKNKVAGLGFIFSADPFLWKIEGLYINKRPMQSFVFNNVTKNINFNGIKYTDSYKAMIGFDYSHKTWGNWIVEMSGESPITDDKTVIAGEGTKVTAITWRDSFLKDVLSANVVLLTLGDNTGNHLIRGGITYKLDDDWSVVSQLSIINSTGSEAYLKAISNFDRFDISLNYNFDLAN